jgi:RND superfamily putative drug exporter
VIAATLPFVGKLEGAQENDRSAWLPAHAEVTKVLNGQARFQPSETLPAVVVYERDAGITAADWMKAAADAAALTRVDGVDGQVVGPVPARDGKALQIIVPVHGGDEGWAKINRIVGDVRLIIESGGAGLAVHITGPAGVAANATDAFEEIDGTLLYAALGVVIVMLLLTYRSPVLWLIPVIAAVAALITTRALIYLLVTRTDLTVNAQSAGILTVLVFGAGTDYALLLTARYREELRCHQDRHQAMACALRLAGPAIIASAATVVAGMLCLLGADMNSTRGLGPVAAIGIMVALSAMTTLLPALLVIVDRWIFWPVKPNFGSAEPTESGRWARVGRGIARRPRLVWVGTTVALGTMALGLTGMDADVLSNKDTFIGKPDSIVGEEVLAAHFPAGIAQPVVVIGKAPHTQRMREALAGTPGIASVGPPVTIEGYVYMEGILADAPDSKAAMATIDRARTAVHAISGADAKVGGDTAIALDAQRAADDDNAHIIPLVLFVVFVITALLLRALAAPVILLGTVVLSFAAALGVSTLVFEHVLGLAGVDTTFPLFVFVFLVALGIDYNIFLMTRVREEALRHGARSGALVGLAATGGVITSAGLVLAGTFAALATLPVVFVAELGVAVAFGVLLDTIVVRSVLVTAVSLDIGRWMWWPGALSRRPPSGRHARVTRVNGVNAFGAALALRRLVPGPGGDRGSVAHGMAPGDLVRRRAPASSRHRRSARGDSR